MDGNYKHRKTMKKRILYYIWMACAAVLLHSCEDVETHKPYGDGSGHAPGTVQVTSYEQIPGGVTLKFIAPTDVPAFRTAFAPAFSGAFPPGRRTRHPRPAWWRGNSGAGRS